MIWMTPEVCHRQPEKLGFLALLKLTKVKSNEQWLEFAAFGRRLQRQVFAGSIRAARLKVVAKASGTENFVGSLCRNLCRIGCSSIRLRQSSRQRCKTSTFATGTGSLNIQPTFPIHY